MNLEEYRRYAEEFAVLDGAVSRGTLAEWVANALYPIAKDSCDISFTNELLRIPVKVTDSLPKLPDHFGIKGGAARRLLHNTIVPEAPWREPRDIDIVRYRGRASPLDWELAQKYMPDDAAQGKTIEHFSSIPQYLQTRDLTVNELVLLDSTLIVSFRCLIDTRAQILRPSRYRGGSIHAAKQVQGLTVAKMFRLKVEGQSHGEDWLIVGVPESQSLTSFDISVHLDRALGNSEEVALAFLTELQQERFLPDGVLNLDSWIRTLANDMTEGLAFFKHLPTRLRAEMEARLKEHL